MTNGGENGPGGGLSGERDGAHYRPRGFGESRLSRK